MTGKLTYTNILETIPKKSQKQPTPDWKKDYSYEWRWRFLEMKGKYILELSRQDRDDNRMYFNKYGEWVKKKVNSLYDNYVVEEYYYYVTQ